MTIEAAERKSRETHRAGAELVASGDCRDPFAVLGLHFDGPGGCARLSAFHPPALGMEMVPDDGGAPVAMEKIHEAGFWTALCPGRTAPFRYRLRARTPEGEREFDDPYRFPVLLGDFDLHLLGEGMHLRAYERLGAHPTELDGVQGTMFAVWAPNARRVSVVGDFCGWDGRRLPMRLRYEAGVWELFVPGIGQGALYKFEIKAADGEILPLKADPYGFFAETPPGTASIVHGLPAFQWNDQGWMERRQGANDRHAPISIYEVHAGSWRRGGPDGSRYLSYQELADTLIPYVKDMGFSHIEFMPITEYPFDGSWGYQPIGLFAPTSRFGRPEDFAGFVDRCHQAGLGVLADWVPGHFPTDPHGLGLFDGTHLYEHSDPKQGFQPDWNTLVFNFDRNEVRNYLVSNALYWLDRFHLDGLRVDAVASMLYLDYSRGPGQWVPNIHGGNENLGAIHFLTQLNEAAYRDHPAILMVAEELTAWPGVSRPTYLGGLGFGFKWNMGWMHDTLAYFSNDPIHRRWHHGDLTFGMLYAYTENFILPLSHDEVVHGKRSLIGRMPGDRWQRFANLRAYFGFMFGHPGKKMLFMGGEFAQDREWNHDRSLDWHLLADPLHSGMQALLRDLNRVYRDHAALHVHDCEAEGFEWLVGGDAEASTLTFLRHGRAGDPPVLVACNFTPIPRMGYRVGVPEDGIWSELLNTDSEIYGGSNLGNGGAVATEPAPCQGKPRSLVLTLPPLATLILTPRRG